jgi:1-acyl-sn-glycerol-3-phosphate acyltransferase
MPESSAMSAREPMTRTYRAALGLCAPIVRWWGRLEVEGLEHVPAEGPLIIAGNHDSYWDPVVIGLAAIKRRQIRALSKSSLWKVKGMNRVLDGMGQIPIVRGTGDADALDRAIAELRGGSCVGIFPEGTRSLGRTLRPRSGLGRLAAGVPEAVVVPVAVAGATDIPRFPKRPRVRVRFLAPAEGPRNGEAPAAFAARIVADIRALAPISPAGRKPKVAAAPPDG